MTRDGKRQIKMETEPNRGNLLSKKPGVFLSTGLSVNELTFKQAHFVNYVDGLLEVGSPEWLVMKFCLYQFPTRITKKLYWPKLPPPLWNQGKDHLDFVKCEVI